MIQQKLRLLRENKSEIVMKTNFGSIGWPEDRPSNLWFWWFADQGHDRKLCNTDNGSCRS
jgi:hypothetical protein